MYQITRTHDLAGLLGDEALWDELAGGVPFREVSWLGPWWNHFGNGRDPYVLVARDEQQRICGLLPLYVTESSTQGKTLSIIGDGQACSDYVSVLAVQEQACEVATAMAEFLADHAADPEDGWEFIDIDGVVENDLAMSAFATTLGQRGASLHCQSRMSTWFKPRDASWDDHLKNFKKTQRRQMRRWSEKVDAIAGLELHTPGNLKEVHRDLDAVIEMHQRRWNAAGEPGSFADTTFRQFVHDVAESFFQRDRLYLSILRFEDRPIAGDFNIIGGNRHMYCYSGGYDADHAGMDPGRILMVESLKHMYATDIAGIDHMRGDETYKRRLSAIPTRILRVCVAAPTFWPKLCHAVWCTGFEVKQWMRRRTGRPPIEVVELGTNPAVAQ